MNELETISPLETEEAVAPPEPVLEQATAKQQMFLFVVTAVVILLDQISKYFVEISLPIYQSYAPIPEIAAFFRFTHATNTGAAFGIFPAGGQFFTIVAIIVGTVILYYNYTLPAGQMVLRLALGLQLGGALGNVIDRFRLGHVTDFLDFGPWPIFNLADTSVVAGVVILAWLMFKEQQQEMALAQKKSLDMEAVGPNSAEQQPFSHE
ncbi:MAG: signal peptidase II [Ardenticatenaceae bacterium]|nr:signal peptidase II [Ardenticatenaceae bacterium]